MIAHSYTCNWSFHGDIIFMVLYHFDSKGPPASSHGNHTDLRCVSLNSSHNKSKPKLQPQVVKQWGNKTIPSSPCRDHQPQPIQLQGTTASHTVWYCTQHYTTRKVPQVPPWLLPGTVSHLYSHRDSQHILDSEPHLLNHHQPARGITRELASPTHTTNVRTDYRNYVSAILELASFPQNRWFCKISNLLIKLN